MRARKLKIRGPWVAWARANAAGSPSRSEATSARGSRGPTWGSTHLWPACDSEKYLSHPCTRRVVLGRGGRHVDALSRRRIFDVLRPWLRLHGARMGRLVCRSRKEEAARIRP